MIDRALALWSTMFGPHPFWTIVLVLVIYSIIYAVVRQALKAFAGCLAAAVDLVAEGQRAWQRRRLSARKTFH